MIGVTVRPATLDDLPQLAAVHYETWMATYRGITDDAWLATLSPSVFEGYHRPRLTPPFDPAQIVLVAVDELDRVIGFARAGPTRDKSPTGDPLPEGFMIIAPAELYAIYVHPRAQGTGAGHALLQAAAREMLALGYRKMCLWVLSENMQARHWYRRRGAQKLEGHAPITLGGKKYDQTAYVWYDLAKIAKTKTAEEDEPHQ